MNKQKQIKIILGLVGLLVGLSGCNETHALKKQAMVQQWQQSTASAQLPAIENLLEQGQIQKAKNEIKKCIQADPELPGAYILIGRIHFMEGRYEQARQAFEHAVALDPQLDQGWHFLGSLAVLEKDYALAVSDFQKAIDLMPAKTDYILSISDVYVEMEQFDKAFELIDTGLEKQPQNLEFMLSKARLYQQMGNIDKAIGVYEQARLMHGDQPQILEPCGYAYITQKQWSSAAEKFAQLIKQYPENDPRYSVTMRSLATCLFNSGQYGPCLFWYDKLSVIYRDDAEIWLDMAQASLGLDDPKRASYCAVNALKAKPSWPKAYAVLGSAQYMQGLYEQSLQAFYKITDDSELAAFAWFMSGRCYQQLGQSRQANAAFEKAEKLDPNNELIASFTKKTIHPL
jgi:tetratricopeptide (TPR) repeat protein